jgi:hypothetical protein
VPIFAEDFDQAAGRASGRLDIGPSYAAFPWLVTNSASATLPTRRSPTTTATSRTNASPRHHFHPQCDARLTFLEPLEPGGPRLLLRCGRARDQVRIRAVRRHRDRRGVILSGGYNDYVLETAIRSRRGRRGVASLPLSGVHKLTEVALPPSAARQSIQLRWRVGSDESERHIGQNIDSIVIREPQTLPGDQIDCDDANACTSDLCVRSSYASTSTIRRRATTQMLAPTIRAIHRSDACTPPSRMPVTTAMPARPTRVTRS